MGEPKMDLRGMIEKQINRLDSVLAIKTEEAINSPKPTASSKNSPANSSVDDICKLAETINRLIIQANTM